MRTRPAAVAVVAVGLVVALALVLAGYEGRGPLAGRLSVTVTHVQPVGIRDPGTSGGPLTLLVVLPWPREGFCAGQFTVSVRESDRQVQVGEVTSVEHRNGSCAGLGTLNGRAAVAASLTTPLGDRAVVRASDGAPLPVVTP